MNLMSNCMSRIKEGDVMKHINSETLKKIERSVDQSYEMARNGMIDAAMSTIEEAYATVDDSNERPLSSFDVRAVVVGLKVS